jgi:integrase
MGRKRTPGLFKRKEVWHIDKQVFGIRLRESTGSSELAEAERYLARRIEEQRQAIVYGVRPRRLFNDAVAKYLDENQHKASIGSDTYRLKYLDKFIGHLAIDSIHMGTLQSFIETRKKEGVKMRTINHGLKVVRHILNLAATEWLDEFGLTWLLHAPKIKLLPKPDLREPYPLSWEEQKRLFAFLSPHLKRMALFVVNTGCRDGEVCNLKWEYEIKVPELNTSVFVIPAAKVKNRRERLIVLNDIAKNIVEDMRGMHPEFVFTYKGNPIKRMLNSAWLSARKKAKLDVRVHDLRHTFGRRLRAACVGREDREDLFGHKSNRMTTHYSAAELGKLIAATNKLCSQDESTPTLTILKRKAHSSHKTSTLDFNGVGEKAANA